MIAIVAGTLLLTGSGDWPHYRGPNHDGTQTGVLDGGPFQLAVDWQRSLGSGYSSIVVRGETGVTLTSDGTNDLAVAFDVETGDEKWRYVIAETYQGHSGSEAGPAATPAIADNAVYGLGRGGDLFALRLDDGKEIWRHRLDESVERTPFFGHAASPVVVGETVVVALGGAGHSICGFDRRDGTLRWAVGDETVNYSSPAVVDGKVVVLNDTFLLGIDPADGKLLFKAPHGMPPAWVSSTPLRVDDEHLLLVSQSNAVMVRVGADTVNGSRVVDEVWRSEAFRLAYGTPVHHEGYLYGFNRRFLTCVDAANGEVAWKSRPPGGGNDLTLLDGHLLIAAPSGDVVVASASPEGYHEVTRLKVFERGGLTAPTVAGGHVFVRNLSHMARLKLKEGTPPPDVAADERELLGVLGDFVREVEALPLDERTTRVEQFLQGHETLPIVEDDGLVHFLYQGEVRDIALQATFLAVNEEVALDRIAGTDLYFKSVRLKPGGIHGYRFMTDFGRPVPDPRNPLRFTFFLGAMSELRMPGATWIDFDRNVPLDGRLDSFQWRSDALGREMRVYVYLPPGYDRTAASYPFVVVFSGSEGVEGAFLDRALDRLVTGERVAPFVALLLPKAIGGLYGERNLDRWTEAWEREILPHMTTHYRLSEAAGDRAFCGPYDGGVVGLYWALRRPGTFDKVAIQTPLLRSQLAEKLLPLLGTTTRPAVTLEKRRLDFDDRQQRVAGEHAERLLRELGEAGWDVDLREVEGSWNWPSWRAQLGEILERFFPPTRR